MKLTLTIAILALCGCVQVITPDGLKINTLLTTSGFDSFYYDPHGILQVGKYKSVPADLHFKFNPSTRTYELVGDSNSL